MPGDHRNGGDDEAEERRRQELQRAKLDPVDRVHGEPPRITASGLEDLRSKRRKGRVVQMSLRMRLRVRAALGFIIDRDQHDGLPELFEIMLQLYLEKYGGISEGELRFNVATLTIPSPIRQPNRMMQRLLCSHGCLNEALFSTSSKRALFVEKLSFAVLANQGTKPHWPMTSSRRGSVASPARLMKGPCARGKTSPPRQGVRPPTCQ